MLERHERLCCDSHCSCFALRRTARDSTSLGHDNARYWLLYIQQVDEGGVPGRVWQWPPSDIKAAWKRDVGVLMLGDQSHGLSLLHGLSEGPFAPCPMMNQAAGFPKSCCLKTWQATGQRRGSSAPVRGKREGQQMRDELLEWLKKADYRKERIGKGTRKPSPRRLWLKRRVDRGTGLLRGTRQRERGC